MIGKYIVLTGPAKLDAYFIPEPLLPSFDEYIEFLPNLYRDDFIFVLTQEATLVPRETFIQEEELWHRVMDTVWYPAWEDWKARVQKWYPNYKHIFSGEETSQYMCEMKQEGWFVDLTKEELDELKEKYNVHVSLSDIYKQDDEFLNVLEIRK